VDTDGKIILQRAQIAELFLALHSAQDALDLVSSRQGAFKYFKESDNTPQVFIEEIESLNGEFEITRQRRLESLNKMYEKHESSIVVTQKRADIIISDAETVATQKHIDSLDLNAVCI
jgi:hypothetical protein